MSPSSEKSVSCPVKSLLASRVGPRFSRAAVVCAMRWMVVALFLRMFSSLDFLKNALTLLDVAGHESQLSARASGGTPGGLGLGPEC